ncbi:MAG: hypothetical protein EOM91_04600 [Sphingobacteriia bacterium]|nr:hypothetical protein [Sphingobacteriia bacterium]NCC39101.1 hypothetical protein [Gammaproteobacteria bacterium]
MGRFTEDMGRLRDEIEADRVARKTLITDTRQEVSDKAQAFMRELQESVETLQTKFRDDFAQMAESGRSDRNAFVTQIVGTVSDLRTQAADQQAAVRAAFAESSAAERAAREQAISTLRSEVEALQDGFRRAHADMAVEMRLAGQTFVAGVADAVSGLRRQTVQMVEELTSERAAAAQAWRGGSPSQPAAAPAPSVSERPKVSAKPVQKEPPQKEKVAPAPAPEPYTPPVFEAPPRRIEEPFGGNN